MFKKFLKATAKSFESLYITDIERLLEKDVEWDKREGVWVTFINAELSRDLMREFLCGFLMEKGFHITHNEGAHLDAAMGTPEGKRTVQAAIGFNESDEKLLQITCKDPGDRRLYWFTDMFDELSEYVIKNNMLRSQKFVLEGAFSYSQWKNGDATRQEQQMKELVEDNTYSVEPTKLYVIFLGPSLDRDELRELLIQHAGDNGLTCKVESKASVKAASAKLIVNLKIGYNESDERILHVQNEVSFLGGDASGKLFIEFATSLGVKLAKINALASQDAGASPGNSPKSSPRSYNMARSSFIATSSAPSVFPANGTTSVTNKTSSNEKSHVPDPLDSLTLNGSQEIIEDLQALEILEQKNRKAISISISDDED